MSILSVREDQPVREEITLASLARVVEAQSRTSPKRIDEIYLQSTDWYILRQFFSSSSFRSDERGEYFWYLTYKVRPLPFLEVLVIGRDSEGKIDSRRVVTLKEVFPSKLEDNL